MVVCGNHSVFCDSGGNVFVRGKAGLAFGNQQRFTPVEWPNMPFIQQVASPRFNTRYFFLDRNGDVWCCGDNKEGRLGISDKNNKIVTSPTKIPKISGVVSIACGDDHTILRDNVGRIWGCGSNVDGQMGFTEEKIAHFTQLPTSHIGKIVKVSCGRKFTVFQNDYGELWVTGDNKWGQLGLDNTTDKKILQFTKTIFPDEIKDFSCGALHTMILDSTGGVWGTGNNQSGQLGLGDQTNRNTFTKLSIAEITIMFCGNTNTFMVNKDGQVFGCGESESFCDSADSDSDHILIPQIIPGVQNIIGGDSFEIATLLEDSNGALWEYSYLLGQDTFSRLPEFPIDYNTLDNLELEFTLLQKLEYGKLKTAKLTEKKPILEKYFSAEWKVANWSVALDVINERIRKIHTNNKINEAEQKESNSQSDLDMLKQMKSIIEPIAQVEVYIEELKEQMSCTRIQDWNTEQASLFFLKCGIPVQQLGWDGRFLSTIGREDFLQEDNENSLLIWKRFEYQRSLAEAGLFGQNHHQVECNICRLKLEDALDEYQLEGLSYQALQGFTTGELMILTADELNYELGVTNKDQLDHINSALNTMRKTHNNYIEKVDKALVVPVMPVFRRHKNATSKLNWARAVQYFESLIYNGTTNDPEIIAQQNILKQSRARIQALNNSAHISDMNIEMEMKIAKNWSSDEVVTFLIESQLFSILDPAAQDDFDGGRLLAFANRTFSNQVNLITVEDILHTRKVNRITLSDWKRLQYLLRLGEEGLYNNSNHEAECPICKHNNDTRYLLDKYELDSVNPELLRVKELRVSELMMMDKTELCDVASYKYIGDLYDKLMEMKRMHMAYVTNLKKFRNKMLKLDTKEVKNWTANQVGLFLSESLLDRWRVQFAAQHNNNVDGRRLLELTRNDIDKLLEQPSTLSEWKRYQYNLSLAMQNKLTNLQHMYNCPVCQHNDDTAYLLRVNDIHELDPEQVKTKGFRISELIMNLTAAEMNEITGIENQETITSARSKLQKLKSIHDSFVLSCTSHEAD